MQPPYVTNPTPCCEFISYLSLSPFSLNTWPQFPCPPSSQTYFTTKAMPAHLQITQTTYGSAVVESSQAVQTMVQPPTPPSNTQTTIFYNNQTNSRNGILVRRDGCNTLYTAFQGNPALESTGANAAPAPMQVPSLRDVRACFYHQVSF